MKMYSCFTRHLRLLTINMFLVMICSDLNAQTVNISVESGSGQPGETVNLAVRTSDLTGLGVIAVQFRLNFNSNILTANNATTAGTIASIWGNPTFNATSGQIAISMAGATALSGSGDLVIVEFTVNSSAQPGQSTPISISDLLINEGNVSAVGVNGLFRVEGDVGPDVVLFVPSQTTGTPGSSVSIPVNVANAIGKNIISVAFDLEFNSQILSGTNVSIAGSVVSNWNFSFNLEAGRVRVALAGTQPIASDGLLAEIGLSVNSSATPGSSSPLNITNVLLNEGGIPFKVINGTFLVESNHKIAGSVTYFDSNLPVPNVSMNLSGTNSANSITDINGNYEFADLASGNYVLTPSKSGDQGNAIGHFDASLVLRYFVGLIDLSNEAQMAADVSGDGQPTPFDAALILQYVVELISGFPRGVEWLFSPPVRSYFPLDFDVLSSDFTAIVLGDVSGNWSSGSVLSKNVADTNSDTVMISLPDMEIPADIDTFAWPVEISDVTGLNVLSFGFDISYEKDVIELLRIANDSSTISFVWGAPTYNLFESSAKVAMAGSQPLSGAGKLLILEFKVKDKSEGTSTVVSFSNVLLNEGQPVAIGIPGHLSIVTSVFVPPSNIPKEFKLYANYPNPFNPETLIQYQLPKQAEVRLEIYNILGELVKTLVDKKQPAGYYTARWNGRDEHGRPVASGVYLYSLRAGEFVQVRKMIFVR